MVPSNNLLCSDTDGQSYIHNTCMQLILHIVVIVHNNIAEFIRGTEINFLLHFRWVVSNCLHKFFFNFGKFHITVQNQMKEVYFVCEWVGLNSQLKRFEKMRNFQKKIRSPSCHATWLILGLYESRELGMPLAGEVWKQFRLEHNTSHEVSITRRNVT